MTEDKYLEEREWQLWGEFGFLVIAAVLVLGMFIYSIVIKSWIFVGILGIFFILFGFLLKRNKDEQFDIQQKQKLDDIKRQNRL